MNFQTPRENIAPIPRLPAPCLAFCGDHGEPGANQTAVANLMKSWEPTTFVVLGDCAYDSGSVAEVDAAFAIWEDEIDDEKVYACIGNHDNDSDRWEPLVNKFTYWPGNRRTFGILRGNIGLILIHSGYNTAGQMIEPNGNTADSIQAEMVRAEVIRLRALGAHWILGGFHHGAYTSAITYYPGNLAMRWDWKALGFDLILNGHSHVYERLVVDGVTHISSGNGGKDLVAFNPTILAGSKVRDATRFGAVKITDLGTILDVEAHGTDGYLIDHFQLVKEATDLQPDTVS